MNKRISFLCLGMLILGAVSFLLHCSSKKDTGVNNPAPKIIEMSGSLTFPGGSNVNPQEVVVGFGDADKSVDSAGGFSIKGREHVPGLAIASDQSGATLLMGIVPDPQSGLHLAVDAHSTAIAVAFLCPLICASSRDAAVVTIQELESLPELTALEDVISAKLEQDPQALTYDDPDIDNALSNLVAAYLNSFPVESGKYWQTNDDSLSVSKRASATGVPEIYPNTTVSGLRLTWNGGNEYQVSNAFGRWAYCCTSQDTFMVFPNGDLLDAIKLKKPWSPSIRKFTMPVEPGGDTAYVDIYGYGFWQSPDNSWDSLSHTEQNYAHYGGITTVTAELVVNVISVITNTPRVYGNEEIAKRWSKTGWDIIVKNAKYAQKAEEYIKAHDPWGLAWYLTKQIISEYTMSDSYREFIQYTLGLSITSAALERLSRWIAVPVKAVVDFNSVTTVMKTAMALTTAHFATSFKVWKEVEDFGGVQGHVGDKISGNPIQGATVVLTGDDGNPLNPPHQKTTDATGYYLFTSIGTGTRTITVSKSGYQTAANDVTIEKNQTVTSDFVLELNTGGLSGRVLNDIFVHNGITPSEFSGTAVLTYRQTSGQRSGSIYVYGGHYSLSLPEGSWWIIASFDNYYSDSITANVPANGNVTASRDLILKPNPSITGTISLDMNSDGVYEIEYPLVCDQAGLSKPGAPPNGCPWGGQPMLTMEISGVRTSSSYDYDGLGLGLNTTRITQTGQYNIGGLEYYGCTGGNVSSSASFATTRQICTTSWGQHSPMAYSFQGNPEMAGCNCGITSPGSLYLEAWGTQVADSVVGSYTVQLAGSKTCECSGDDTNGDGKNDHWDVSCARVKLEIYFRLFVGTDYLVTFTPYSASLK